MKLLKIAKSNKSFYTPKSKASQKDKRSNKTCSETKFKSSSLDKSKVFRIAEKLLIQQHFASSHETPNRSKRSLKLNYAKQQSSI